MSVIRTRGCAAQSAVLGGALVLMLLLATSASAAPLPGSAYDSGDGNQDTQLSGDWQSAQAQGRVKISRDRNDDCFIGGVKELSPDGWAFNNSAGGCTPGKSNVRVAFVNPETLASTSYSHFAFLRNDTTGNTFLTFELNRTPATWVNSTGTTIPCRSNGDILLSFEVGGSSLQSVLYRWTGDGSGPTSCPNGANGTFVGSGVIPGSRSQGTMNSAQAITNYVDSASFGASFPANSFGEAAIDIPAVLQAMGQSPCVSFLQMQVHSRSSSSIASAMIDYTEPVPVNIQSCAAIGEKYADVNANGARDGGENGLAGFEFYADLDDDGVRDAGEPTGTSDASGFYRIPDLAAGDHKIREVARPGWRISAPAPDFYQRALITGGNSIGNDFGNVAPATASGTRFHDLNASGLRDAGEPGQAGWTYYADLDGDGVRDLGDPSGSSDASGAWTIENVPAGAQTIREVPQAGWNCSAPAGCAHARTFVSGATVSGLEFGGWTPAGVSGNVFEDLDGDGAAPEAGDAALGAWQVYLDANDNNAWDLGEIQTTTDPAGNYTLAGGAPGTPTVRVTGPPAGWYCTRPGATTATCERALTLISGQLAGGQDFGFTRTATISGTVFNDADNSGTRGAGETAWTTATTIYADLNANAAPDAGEPSVSTSTGSWTLTGVPAGTVAIRQTSGGFTCTTPPGCAFTLTPISGQTLSGYEFGNYVATSKGISGTIWLDANANGVKDVAEITGVAGITVYADNDKNGSFGAGDITGVTNGAGAYAVTSTANGTAVVRVKPDTLGAYTCSFPAGCSITVTGLGNGASSPGNDFGVYGPAAVSGTLAHDLNANGIKDGAETAGLSGRTIYDDANGNLAFDAATERNATTAADGTYTLTGLNPGSHTIRVVTNAGFVCSSPSPCSHVVQMASINLGDRDFLTWTPATVTGALFEDADADGAAREPGELALANRTVYLDANDNAVKDIAEIAVLSGVDGTYTFAALVPGGHTVRQVLPAGWVQDAPAGAYAVAAVSAGSYAARDFSSHTTATISGRVFDDADFQGDPFESGDAAMAGRTVYLDANANAELDGGESSVITDGFGDYMLTVAPGAYSVRTVPASADRACASPSGCAYAIGGTSGSSYSGRDFGSYVGATVSGAVFEDADADGAPREGGEPPAQGLRVYLDADDNGVREASEPTTLTAADGSYSFRGVTAQTWLVRMELSAGWTCDSPSAPCAHSVVLTSGATQPGNDFGVHTAATISGHLYTDRDNDGGAQVFGENDQPGRTVYVDANANAVPDAGETQTVTDELGNYSFTGLQPGDYAIRQVLPTGWQPSVPADALRSVAGLVSGETRAAQNFSSWTTADITGRVFEDSDADGEFREAGEPGLAPRTVYLDTTPNGAFDGGEPSAVTAADGSYAFADLAPGPYTVRPVVPATWSCSYPAGCSTQLVVEAGEVAQDTDFGLWTNGTLAGTVYSDFNGDGDRDGGEGPLANRLVFVDLDGDANPGAGEPSQTTDADGAYAFALRPDAAYTVIELPAAGWVCTTAPCALTAAVSSGQTLGTLDFGNQPNTATVSGAVYADLDADAVRDGADGGRAGRIVWVDYDDDGTVDAGEPFATTDADGSYTIVGVSPGQFRVRYDAPAGEHISDPAAEHHVVTFGSGDVVLAKDFGSYVDAVLSGTVYDDKDGSGDRQAGENGLSNKTVELDVGADGSVEDTTTSGADGAYSFTGRTPGSYRVTVVVGAGNLCTAPAPCRWDRTVTSGATSTGNDFAIYRVPVADLSLAKSAPATVAQKETFDYTLVATNNGPDAAQSVSITDTLPAGVQFVDAGPGCAYAAPTVTCTIATIASGDSATRTITVEAIDAGAISNSATVSSPTGDPTPANDSDDADVTVAPVADLRIVKTGPQTVAAGALATYTVTAYNDGPSTADGVVLRDEIPSGMTFDGSSDAGWTLVAPGVYENAVGSIASGDSTSRDIVLRARHAAADSTQTNRASVDATTIDDTPDNDGDAAVTDVGPSANLAITKTIADETIAQGADAVYTLTLTNNGPSAAANVTVTDALPAGMTFVSLPAPGSFDCTTPAVGAGGTVTCSTVTLPNAAVVTFTLTVRATTTGTRLNTAGVTSTTPDADLADNSGSASAEVAPTADVSVAKTAPETVVAGENVTYGMTVTNDGPSMAHDVAVSDTLPPGMTFVSLTVGAGASCTSPAVGAGGTIDCTIATLAADAQVVLSLVARATFALAGQTLTNTASASAQEFDPQTAGNTSSAETVVGPVADLRLTKSASAPAALQNSQLTYTLTASNDGPSDATNVTVTDTLPSGVSFVSGSAGCTAGAGTVTCALGDVADGSNAVATITVRANANGTQVNTATVASDDPDPDPSDDSASATVEVGPTADLSIVKTSSPSVTAGGQVSYALTAHNAGPSSATGVTVVDVLPSGMTYAGSTSSQGACAFAAGTVTCALGGLATGASATATITATATFALSGTTVPNTASIFGDQNDDGPANNASTYNVNVGPAADLVLTDDAPAHVPAGGQLLHSLQLANIGPQTAVNSSFTVTLPAGVTFVSATPTQGSCSAGGQTVTCSVGDLPAGSAMQMLLTVHAADSLGGSDIAVSAVASSDTTEIDEPSNRAGATTTVDPAPIAPPAPAPADGAAAPAAAARAAGDLRITKTADDGAKAVLGRAIAYTISVTNAAGSIAHGVVVVDQPSAAVSIGSVRTEKGTCTGLTCRLGDLAPGEVVRIHVVMTPKTTGTFENAAVASSDDGERAVADNRAVAGVSVAAARTTLSLKKTVDRKVVRAGGTVWFTITARNTGRTSASDVRVCDRSAFNTTFVTVRGARFTRGRACWTTPALKAGARLRYRVKVRVSGTERSRASTSATVTASNADSRRAHRGVRVIARQVLAGAGVTG